MGTGLEVESNPAAPLPAFRRTVCSACGYSLAGLTGSGRCPECGTPYQSDGVVLYGWARGILSSAENSRGRVLAWRLVQPAVLIWINLSAYYRPGTHHWLAILSVAATVPWVWMLARGLVRLARPQSDDGDGRPGPVQVRLNDGGLGQFETRRQAGDLSAAARGYANWTGVTSWEWRPTAADRHRIRIVVGPMSWLKVAWVDAEVRCAADDAPRVRQAIERWVADARAAADVIASAADRRRPETTRLSR